MFIFYLVETMIYEITKKQKNMKNLKVLFTVLCITCTSLVWGEEEVAYTNDCPSNSSASGYTTYYDVTINGIDWKAPGNQYANGAWRIGAKERATYDRYIYSKTAINKNITKIVVSHGASVTCTVNSFKLDVYSTAAKAATGGTGDISSLSGTFQASGTTTFTRPAGKDWTGRFYRFTYNLTTNSTSARYITPASYVFYYETGSTKTSV